MEVPSQKIRYQSCGMPYQLEHGAATWPRWPSWHAAAVKERPAAPSRLYMHAYHTMMIMRPRYIQVTITVTVTVLSDYYGKWHTHTHRTYTIVVLFACLRKSRMIPCCTVVFKFCTYVASGSCMHQTSHWFWNSCIHAYRRACIHIYCEIQTCRKAYTKDQTWNAEVHIS